MEIPKPVAIGETFELDIDGEGGQGDGIARKDGFIIFVKGARKGEKCKIKITEVKRTFATGEKI
ncbi:TRAM domain-containing protein [Candidatus Micrarchaeota archaeon]|nr:TRAM domain-containing protein [Candidatus Micrarchaeota archaeon]